MKTEKSSSVFSKREKICKSTVEKKHCCTHFDEKKEAMEAYLGRVVSEQEVRDLLAFTCCFKNYPLSTAKIEVSFCLRNEFADDKKYYSSEHLDETAGIHLDYISEDIEKNNNLPINVLTTLRANNCLVFREIFLDEESEFGRAITDDKIKKLIKEGCLRVVEEKPLLIITDKLTREKLSKFEIKPADIYKYHETIFTMREKKVTKENLKQILSRKDRNIIK